MDAQIGNPGAVIERNEQAILRNVGEHRHAAAPKFSDSFGRWRLCELQQQVSPAKRPGAGDFGGRPRGTGLDGPGFQMQRSLSESNA